MTRDPNRRRFTIAERLIEVIDDRQTGETILDEALKMMKGQEEAKMSVNTWIDLLSGEFVLFLTFLYLDPNVVTVYVLAGDGSTSVCHMSHQGDVQLAAYTLGENLYH